jgi:hypothetical protein
METEEDIVYSIIETVKKGNLTDDNKINERVVRGFLKIYRASVIAKNSTIGVTITDECFQYLGNLRFNYVKPKQFSRELPKILLLNTFGIQAEVIGENIPILKSEEYALSLKTLLNGKMPKAKMTGNKLTIYIGEYLIVNGRKKPKQNIVIDELSLQASTNANMFIDVEVTAILDNPDDAPGYDWTTDPYPCPSELIEEIKTRILAKEFNLILSIKADKVTDSDDNDGYQEQQRNRRGD